MAMSDACFEFLADFGRAAGKLAESAHHYSAPDYPIPYGAEVDALRRVAAIVHGHPYDVLAGAHLLRLATAIGAAHDTPPGSDDMEERTKKVRELIGVMGLELTDEDAKALPAIMDNVVTETPYSEKAAGRLKEMLSKVGKSTYDTAVKVIGDVAAAAVKKYLGM